VKRKKPPYSGTAGKYFSAAAAYAAAYDFIHQFKTHLRVLRAEE
jgi:hypothetical protein